MQVRAGPLGIFLFSTLGNLVTHFDRFQRKWFYGVL